MDIMTKVRVLWEKVAGLTADVSAVETQATATAATLAGILPRIPADYSTEQVNTGVKWIDGKDIYCKVLAGTLPEITSTTTIEIGTIPINSTLLNIILLAKQTNNILYNNFTCSYINTTGSVRAYLTTQYSDCDYYAIVYYTEPTATREDTPAQADNEIRKRKTTKKEEK